MSTELPAPPQAAQPPAPKRKRGLPKWLVTIIAIVVVGGGFYAYNYFTSDVAQAKAGDCAKVTGTQSKPDYQAVGCDSADANVIVAKAMSNTSESCNGDYLEFTMTARRGPDAKLCLMPKLDEGQCYKLDTGDTVDIAKQACGGSGVVKVVKVVKGTADDAQCAEGTSQVTFPEPPTTFCLEPARA